MSDSDTSPPDASDEGDTSPKLPTPREALTLALNLARRTGWKLFPVRADKRPRVKGWPAIATSDPDELRKLWRRFPDPLIGIACGKASGLWVLDLDTARHQTAIDWWHDHHHRLMPTRVYATRSGGFHLYFRDGGEQGNSAGRLAEGIDVRGNGGYVISWFCAGYECLDSGAIAPWPAWLASALARPVAVPRPARPGPVRVGDGDWIGGLLRTLAGAGQGSRNDVLYWCACRMLDRGLKLPEVEALLLPAAVGTGLPDFEARRSIASAVHRH